MSNYTLPESLIIDDEVNVIQLVHIFPPHLNSVPKKKLDFIEQLGNQDCYEDLNISFIKKTDENNHVSENPINEDNPIFENPINENKPIVDTRAKPKIIRVSYKKTVYLNADGAVIDSFQVFDTKDENNKFILFNQYKLSDDQSTLKVKGSFIII